MTSSAYLPVNSRDDNGPISPFGGSDDYRAPSPNTAEGFHFSTQLRKGSVEAGALYPPPGQSEPSSSRSSITPSAYYTHLTASSLLTVLSPHPEIPIDTERGLSQAAPPTIRSRLPWSTSARDNVSGKEKVVRGYNEFAVKEGDSALTKLIDQLKEPLILLLLGSAVVSLILGEKEDAVSIVIAVGIVVAVAFIQERRSSESLKSLNKLVPHFCHLVRDGVTSHVLANELVPGDVVTFATGDRIPADLRVVEAVQLELDESTLTGEIKPRKKIVETTQPEIDLRTALSSDSYGRGGSVPALPPHIHATSIGERENIAFMGTLVKSGYGRGIVVATGPQTEFGSIFSMVDEVVEKRTPLQLSMDDLAQKLSMISFAIIGVICLIGLWQRRGALEMFTIGVSLAVAAIPEGLPIVVTVTLALGVLRMSNRKAIVKRLPSVETLGSVSVICSDKTGTLTTNKQTICRCFTLEDGMLDLTQRDSIPHSQGRALTRTLLVGNLCNNSHRDERGENVGQATDVAMVNVLRVFGIEDKRPYFKRSNETAFSSETKFMSATGSFADGTGNNSAAAPLAANIGSGETVYLKGAIEVVLSKCSHYLAPSTNAQSTPILDETTRKHLLSVGESLASEGLRVLACATGRVGADTSNKMTFCGLQAMQDPPRAGVQEAVTELRRGGIQVVMITGDSEGTAWAVGRQVGLVDGPNPKEAITTNGHGPSSSPTSSLLMTGRQIDLLSERQLQEVISRVAIFARTTPRHKMDIVKALQANGGVVAMTGDGVNDAPALKMADIGIALGASGTDVAKEAADVILVDDNFATILSAVEEGKGIFLNIQNFLSFQLSTAVAALTLITLSTFFGLKLPLNPMQILFINILMDGPPSQSLGVDPVDRNVVMRKRPRKKEESVLTKRLLMRIGFSATIIVVGTLTIYVSELTGDGFADQRDQTMTFTTFVFLDLISAIQNRSLTTPILGNRILLYTILTSFLVQLLLIYFPWLQGVFQTTSLSFGDLGLVGSLAGISFCLHEGRRRFERGLSEEEEKDQRGGGWMEEVA